MYFNIIVCFIAFLEMWEDHFISLEWDARLRASAYE